LGVAAPGFPVDDFDGKKFCGAAPPPLPQKLAGAMWWSGAGAWRRGRLHRTGFGAKAPSKIFGGEDFSQSWGKVNRKQIYFITFIDYTTMIIKTENMLRM